MIEDTIAEAIANGGAVADAMPAAMRVVAALEAADALVAVPPPYVPIAYPKWVGSRIARSAAEEALFTGLDAPAVAVPGPVPVAPVLTLVPPVEAPPAQ